ncbi:hypothetical protein [Rubripirellula obstinata]|nr:hypothetical protein [Rubripirellula obstinata]
MTHRFPMYCILLLVLAMPLNQNPYDPTVAQEEESHATGKDGVPLPVAYAMVALSAITVGIACFFLTFILFVSFSHAGDFAFMLALLPAIIASFAGGGVTIAIGLGIVAHNRG